MQNDFWRCAMPNPLHDEAMQRLEQLLCILTRPQSEVSAVLACIHSSPWSTKAKLVVVPASCLLLIPRKSPRFNHRRPLRKAFLQPTTTTLYFNAKRRLVFRKFRKKFNVNGDGKLDEAEQAMRDLDKEGRGFLTNDKVYSIFQQQLRMQKQLFLAKRLAIFFAILLVILAVANIGVAFAAARLSKDTTTTNNN